jgi:hypothetical protein
VAVVGSLSVVLVLVNPLKSSGHYMYHLL